MKNSAFLAVILFTLMLFLEPFGNSSSPELFNESLFKGKGYAPSDGFIPNKETAIEIAEIILAQVYGKEMISSERPFHAILNDDVWQIKGTLKKGRLGGVAYIYLSKSTGQILKMIHTQ